MVRIGILARRILAETRARMDANEVARDTVINRRMTPTKGEPPGVTHITVDTLPALSGGDWRLHERIKEGRHEAAQVADAGASHRRRGEET